jgi:hypothetical protein
MKYSISTVLAICLALAVSAICWSRSLWTHPAKARTDYGVLAQQYFDAARDLHAGNRGAIRRGDIVAARDQMIASLAFLTASCSIRLRDTTFASNRTYVDICANLDTDISPDEAREVHAIAARLLETAALPK